MGHISLTLPILEYGHTGGNCAITGGYAYRGRRVPYLYGRYLFGDLCSGRLWWAAQNNGGWTATALAATAGGLYTFGEGADGELYVGPGRWPPVEDQMTKMPQLLAGPPPAGERIRGEGYRPDTMRARPRSGATRAATVL